MRLLIAPASFKGSLSAGEAAQAMATGARRAAEALQQTLECDLMPLADGGEGTVDAVWRARGGTMRQAQVHDPLGRLITASYLLLDDGTAVLEMAAASGLPLLSEAERNPLRASTYGTGELILAACEAGAQHIVIGVGGSATVDAGAGMAQALGVHLRDSDGHDLEPGGGPLLHLAHIDRSGLHEVVRGVEIEVLCDVRNPLVGPQGAPAVFGPQKGATPVMVEQLDAALARFAEVALRDCGVAVSDLPGAGAAGGLAAGLVAILGAELRPGIDVIMDLLEIRGHLANADLVLSGEGRLDGQTVGGKVIAGLARLAQEQQRPLVAIAGRIDPEATVLYQQGLTAAFALADGPRTLQECQAEGVPLLERAAENVLRLWLAAQRQVRE